MSEAEKLRQSILEQVEAYYQLVHAGKPFVAGESRVHYAGRVFDETELQNMVSSVLDFWLTAGPYAQQFENALGRFLGVREIVPVNSGSSANLVAVTTLCSSQLDNPLRPGDEVIVPAASFPTTVNPIIQNQLVPVFIDSNLADLNLDPGQLEEALSPRTRAVMFAHTLGNPADMDAVMAFVRQHDLYLIEDACDALGSTWDGQFVGTFGELATLSFYPAHHITVGEGGAVFTNRPKLAKIARAVRDWGRDCWCGYDSPVNGKCGIRFEREIPGMPGYYDHRYYYTEIGYNLKLTDPQAAMGVAQVEKLPEFVARRRHNFHYLYAGLRQYEDFLRLPQWHPRADPAWFAFPLLLNENLPFQRHDLTRFLELNHIETRLLFAGNILKQPAYQEINARQIGALPVADRILKDAFFVGVFPGLTEPHLDYMIETFGRFFSKY
ncbi:MAG: lipopolysaccharide biosynthesis protein RfbH [Anaerolineales bacterium]|nr:lipopolysaccharide biosynthesis protein RfbH [Anaerolineales bacterium]MCB0028516.1 lipopolysaccharide biosynthesis protein RfbH [Anaerolineales bacterium]MCB8961200.1 lipopolysaccharide biosynthesis protein RfbH [Ardenticatenales bacterium]